MLKKSRFASQIVEWYRQNKRPLPWRETSDPYKIWLSEIILQQTRVAQGQPYYLRFVERFPNVFLLAKAKEKDVLRLWQGLGYYTRARNLYRCAQVIVGKHNGVFPSTFEALKKLPGVGSYTAAALASISFKVPVPVVDGNVFRVLARVFGIEKDISSPATRAYFFALASELIPPDHPDEFNQAIMEFGATHCVPKNPNCEECIFSRTCEARRHALQPVLPVKNKRTKIRTRHFYYFVFVHRGRIMMKKRIAKDIWTGLYDFYQAESDKKSLPQGVVSKEGHASWRGMIDREKTSKTYRHVLTHQIILAKFVLVTLPAIDHFHKPDVGLRFYTKKEIHALPKPVLISRYLSDSGLLA